jgi:5-methylthioadenosine/S-adenosylhomocysteine deaminase
MTRIRIDNAAYVVTLDDHDTILEHVSVEIADGAIRRIGGSASAPPTSPPSAPPRGPVAPWPAASSGGPDTAAGPPSEPDVIIDARGKALLPGLVNLHTHLPMTLLRGLAEDVDLQGFLRRVWAAEAAVMDEPTVELGSRLGALESLLGGCTTQLDMYFHDAATHRGAVAAGARHVTGPVFFDGPGPDGLSWATRLEKLRGWPGVLDAAGGPQVPVAAMPHATYTNSPAHLAEVADVLREVLGESGRRGLLTTHVSENEAENTDVLGRHGATPTALLDHAGWLDGRVPFVAAHGVHLTADDRARLADAGASVAHCPGSNLKLASGALPWEELRENGIRVGVGTDGCASSNDLDMWQAMRQTALLARLTSGRPDVASARDVLRAATIDGARALGLGDLIGSIEVGKRADLVLLDLDRPHLTPIHDITALLVFAAGRADVTDVIVDGDIVVRNGRSTRLDVAELLARVRERGAVARDAASVEASGETR